MFICRLSDFSDSYAKDSKGPLPTDDGRGNEGRLCRAERAFTESIRYGIPIHALIVLFKECQLLVKWVFRTAKYRYDMMKMNLDERAFYSSNWSSVWKEVTRDFLNQSGINFATALASILLQGDWNGNKLFLVSRFLHSVQQPNSYVYHQHVDLNTVYKEIHNVNILHPQMIDQIHPIMKGAVRSWTTPQRKIQRSQPEELMIEPIMVPTPTINRPKRHNQGKCS